MYIKQGKNRNLSNKTLLEITLTPKSNSKEKIWQTPKFEVKINISIWRKNVLNVYLFAAWNIKIKHFQNI